MLNAPSRRASRAKRTPKGSTPFSAPHLFAGARAPRARRQRSSPLVKRIDAPVATTSVVHGNTGPAGRTFSLVRREFVADVSGSVAFTATSFSVNPGLVATFPGGGQLAPSWEEYEVNSISFCYDPESASSATGSVILGFDYDALDSAPTTKQEILEFADSLRAAPWVPCRLSLKAGDLRKRGTLYTRTGPVANSDLKTYDLGNLFVATVGQSGSSVIGELWIEYNFTLRTPQLPKATSSSITSSLISGSSPSPTSVFGSSGTVTGSSLATAAVNTLTFSTAGQYLVSMSVTGGNTAGTGTGPVLTGSTATYTAVGGGSNFSGSSWTSASFDYIVTATAGQTMVFNWSTIASTLTASSTRITQYTYSLG